MSPFWGSDEDDEPETEKQTEHRTLTEQFERITVRFRFVRGGQEMLTYDVFDGYVEPDDKSGHNWGNESIEDGVVSDTRGDAQVLKLTRVSGVKPLRSDGENHLRLWGEETGDEVFPANIASRHVQDRVQMEAALPVEETVKREVESEHVVYRSPPKRDGELTVHDFVEQ